jgi:23S rRNA (adenine2503-C2)-methyltransferase
MKILKRIPVPTGDIIIGEGQHGLLEFVSLGDYGKEVNLNQDKEVPNSLPLMPLTEKWVITISTQYGCSMNCTFCDVPKVGPGKNATLYDMQSMILEGLFTHPEVTSSKRLNIHYARMGEPTWNPEVLDHAKWLKDHIDPEYNVHPVVSTMMPRKNIWLKTFIHNWMRLKNRVYRGNAGLQLSINSTNEVERAEMFSGNALYLNEIAKIMDGVVPTGRKITLNFAVADYQIKPDVLLNFFNPAMYLIKLTPMHRTVTALKNKIETSGDYTTPYPYEHHAKALRDAGYDVLVFIASRDEDEGLITCGNAILSGSTAKERIGELKFRS